MFKKLIKNLQNSLNKITPKLTFRRFDLYLLLIFLLIQTALLALTLFESSFQFNWVYIKNYYIQLIVVFIVASSIFFLSFRDYVKKNANFSLFLIYFFAVGLMSLNIIGLNALVENLTNRAFFSTSNYLFITLFLVLTLTLISKYDFPMTENWKEFYLETMGHMKRNIGIYLAIAVIVAILGFYVETFVYAISFILIIDSIYVLKGLLANIRR